MKKYNFLQSAKNTFQIEAKAVSDLSNQLDSNFEKLCLSALESKGLYRLAFLSLAQAFEMRLPDQR